MAMKSKERAEKWRLTRKKKLDGLTKDEAARLAALEAKVPDKYKSAAERVVDFHVEERSAVEATGDAAALAARAEGNRLDYVMTNGIDALVRAAKINQEMASMLLQRTGELMEGQAVLLDSVNGHYLEKTRLESELLKLKLLEGGGTDANDELVAEFMRSVMAGWKAGNGKKRKRAARSA